MKKILLIFILTFLGLSSILFAELDYTWKVTRSGGELHGIWPFRWIGYETVIQNPAKKELSCTGKGLHECKLTPVEIPQCVASHTNTMIEYADMQVYDGIMSGSFTENYYCGSQYYLSTVTWSTDENGITIMNVTNIPVNIPF